MNEKELVKLYLKAAKTIKNAVEMLYENYTIFNHIEPVKLWSGYEKIIDEEFKKNKNIPVELKEEYKKTFKEIYDLVEGMKSFAKWVQLYICNPYYKDYFNGFTTGDPEIDGGLYIDDDYIKEIKNLLDKKDFKEVEKRLKIGKRGVIEFYKDLVDFVKDCDKLLDLSEYLESLQDEILEYVEENSKLASLLDDIKYDVIEMSNNYRAVLTQETDEACEKVFNLQIPSPPEQKITPTSPTP